MSVLGVSEVRWREKGEIRSGDYTVHYSGNVVKGTVYNDRIIPIKLQIKPVSILLVRVCLPTSQFEDEEVQELCDIIKKLLNRMENVRQTLPLQQRHASVF